MSSQTADINQEQEQQEQDIPEQDPNRVVEDGEVGDAEMEDSVDVDLYGIGKKALIICFIVVLKLLVASANLIICSSEPMTDSGMRALLARSLDPPME